MDEGSRTHARASGLGGFDDGLSGYPAFMRLGGLVGTIVVIWLLIGVFATWQRGYFSGGSTNCAAAGSIALTVLAGPLNYAGVNPKVAECNLPEPSAMTVRNILETRS